MKKNCRKYKKEQGKESEFKEGSKSEEKQDKSLVKSEKKVHTFVSSLYSNYECESESDCNDYDELSESDCEKEVVEFILDSGATAHQTGNKDLFSKLRKLKSPTSTMLADGSRVGVEHKGTKLLLAI